MARSKMPYGRRYLVDHRVRRNASLSLRHAVYASGVVWMTSFDDNMVVEMLGAAAPTTTPLPYAASVNKLGAKP
jgi:hypothetical protein